MRKTLVGETGTVLGVLNGDCHIGMDILKEHVVRQITEGSSLRVICMQSPQYMLEAIALEDGRLDGWCLVSINDKPYTIPTMWLLSITMELPRSKFWLKDANVKVRCENTVLIHKENTPMLFSGESSALVVPTIAKFDPLSIVTPKIFRVLDVTMREWSVQAQKDAVIECMCQKHMESPDTFFRNESVVDGMSIHFNWKGSTGTLSIFESGEELFFYIDNSFVAIRAQARIGRADTEGGIIRWETSAHHTVVQVERIRQRDAGLLVIGSSITHAHDHNRIGTVMGWVRARCKDIVPKKCSVHWDLTGPGIVEEENVENLERSVLMRTVVMQPSLVSGTVQNHDIARRSKYVLIKFTKNTTIGSELGQAWFDLDQLNYKHLEYKLRNFLSYPWRTARFTIQERVGMSIKSLYQSQCKVSINTDRALRNFHATLIAFCDGARRMHEQNIAHCDLNPGNITLTQSMDGETFALKMIDFDQMKQYQAKNVTVMFHTDLKFILKGITTLLKLVQCQSDDEGVTRNFLLHVIALIQKVTTFKQRLHGMSNYCPSIHTVQFFADMQMEFRFEP